MMKRWSILVIVFCVLVLPLSAQDSYPTPYEIALERIHEAQESGATELDLSELGLTEIPPELWQLAQLWKE